MDSHTLKVILIYLKVGAFGAFFLFLAWLIKPNTKFLALIQKESHEYEKALENFKLALEKNPNDTTVIRALSDQYRLIGKPDLEIHYLKMYLEKKPDDIQARMELARVYQWNLKPKLAIIEYNIILDQYNPHHTEVLSKLAITYTWNQESESAIECYKKLTEMRKMKVEDYRNLINIYISQSDIKSALPIFEKLWARNREELNILDYREYANIQLWGGNESRAFDLMKNMLRKFSQDPQIRESAREAFVEWHLDKEYYNLALVQLNDWINREPQNFNLHQKIIDIYLLNENIENAIAHLENIIKTEDNSDRFKIRLFWIFSDTKKYKKLLELADIISDQIKNRESMWASIAIAHQQLKNYSKAISLYKSILSKDPNNINIALDLTYLYLDSNQIKSADEIIDRLLKQHPENPKILLAKINILSKQDNSSLKTIQWARKGHELFPDNNNFLETLYYTHIDLSQKEKALPYLDRLIKLNPKNTNYVIDKVDYLFDNNQKDQAFALLEKTIPKTTNDPVQLNKIAQRFGWNGQPKRELELLQIIYDKEPKPSLLDQMIRAASDSEDAFHMERLLTLRVKEGRKINDSLKMLQKAYQYSAQPEKELKLLAQLENKNISDIGFIYKRRAEILEDSGQYEKALQLYEKVYPIEIGKDKNELRQHILNLVLWMNNNTLALEIYKKYAKAQGLEGLQFAQMLNSAGELKASKQVFEKLSNDIQESLKGLRLQLTYAYTEKQDSKVLSILEKLIHLEKEPKVLAELHRDLAQLYKNEGRTEKAFQVARQAQAYDPRNISILKLIAALYFDQTEYESAIEYYLKSKNKLLVYERIQLGSAHVRLGEEWKPAGRRILLETLDSIKDQHTLERWNYELDVGYELLDKVRIEEAWTTIVESFDIPYETKVRYALHLIYTERRQKAWDIYRKLPVMDHHDYLELAKTLEPEKHLDLLTARERRSLALTYRDEKNWFEAMKMLK